MANEEHVALLKQGVDIWNEWRRENPDVYYPALSGANLRAANLNVRAANLSEAILYQADLSGADLSGANLDKANLWITVFGDTDLSKVKGLDQCQHYGPSIIDHRTLQNS